MNEIMVVRVCIINIYIPVVQVTGDPSSNKRTRFPHTNSEHHKNSLPRGSIQNERDTRASPILQPVRLSRPILVPTVEVK